MTSNVPVRTRKTWECHICMETCVPRERVTLLCGHHICVHCAFKLLLHARYPVYQSTHIEWMGIKIPYIVKTNAPSACCPYCRGIFSPITQFCIDRQYHLKWPVSWQVECDRKWQDFWECEQQMVSVNRDALRAMQPPVTPRSPPSSPVALEDELPTLHDLFVSDESDNDWDIDLNREQL